MKKVLVSYFSASGETKKLGDNLAKVINADVFEIVPETLYTKTDLDWTKKQSRSTIEMNDTSSRPAIALKCGNMNDYDTVFVGFPIWWYVAPRIIDTFLESYDFSGKTVIPFATSGGSGMGKTVENFKKILGDKVKILDGKVLNRANDAEIKAWVKTLGI